MPQRTAESQAYGKLLMNVQGKEGWRVGRRKEERKEREGARKDGRKKRKGRWEDGKVESKY